MACSNCGSVDAVSSASIVICPKCGHVEGAQTTTPKSIPKGTKAYSEFKSYELEDLVGFDESERRMESNEAS